MNNNLVSIITVNYNNYNDTILMIDSIINYVSCRYEIIVVDNGSKGDDFKILNSRYSKNKNVVLVSSIKNLGFAGGNNLGIKYAKGNYLFFLNNDTEVVNDPIPNLLARFESNKKIAAVSPMIRFFWGEQLIQFAGYTDLSKITLRNNLIGYMKPISKEYLTPCKTPFIHGAAFMIKREIIDKVGLMPENYFLYYEELDWSERIKEKDYELWYEPNSLVLHKESQSTGNDSPLKTYYMVKNRLTFAKRNRNMILFCFSFLYQLSIALPKLILVNIKKNRNDLNKSALMGFLDFLKSK